jgi:hypothetical protein
LKFLAVLLALFCTSAQADELITFGAQGTFVDSLDPQSPDTLSSLPFNCIELGKTIYGPGFVEATYTMPKTVRLKAMLFFPGVNNRVVADVGWKLTNQTTGQLLYYTNWDHYPAPQLDAKTAGAGGPLTPQQVYVPLPAGDWITLHQGDVIKLRAYCTNAVSFGFAVQAHVAATLYGTVVTP